MDKAIVVDRLVKNFDVLVRNPGVGGALASFFSAKKKIVKAVDDISFHIEEGELVGFIGPNGAGKTTTLKVLSGLLYPTSGFTQVLGYTPWERKNEYLKKIALVMGQKNQLWWDLPAIESLLLNKAIYEIPNKTYRESMDELVNLLEVKDFILTPVRKLSLGQRMRLELVAALLHKPKVLFLDEPTIGLDIIAQQKMRDFIRNYNKKHGATILLTSHNMDDVADLASRVVVIDKGKIVFDGELSELVNRFAKEKEINVYFSQEIDIKKLDAIGIVKAISFPRATIAVPRGATPLAAAELLQNFPVGDLTIEEEPLEDVIARVFDRRAEK